jgi:predicted unusual protein kinase regulating ubiquinone biosynthesis (AarF/ABC1/UbiB family)
MLKITASAQDVDALLTELRDRIGAELDYRREAASQRLLAAYFDGHLTIHIPAVIGGLSARRVVTSELSGGARFAELARLDRPGAAFLADGIGFPPGRVR